MPKRNIPTDLALVILLTLLCIPFVLIPPLNEISPVRIILGLPLVLFLPGYALIATLFPRKDDLDGIERIALSFGLSIAITPLLGLALNYTPFGIRFYVIVTPKEGEKFTEFYVLGPNGTASDYPINLEVGGEGNVTLGVVNREYTNVTYLLMVWLSGERIDKKSIVLTPNETWENLFTFKALKKG